MTTKLNLNELAGATTQSALEENQKTTNLLVASVSYDDIEKIIDSARQINLMLRDGLPVNMLTEEERLVYIYIYGESELMVYDCSF